MLVYIDESGFPDLRDNTTNPVLAAVCIPEQAHRKLSREFYKIKSTFFRNPNRELKATKLLSPNVFQNRPDDRELVERVFELIGESGLAVFAAIMAHPKQRPDLPAGFIPNQYRFLLQRIHLYMSESIKPGDMAILIFDGDGTAGIKGGLGPGISNYLFRSLEGQSFSTILTSPLFVDSEITAGIQIADLIAGCIRHVHVHERSLQRREKADDSFESALTRYYRIIQSKTYDFETDTMTYYGLFTMPERYLYQTAKNQEEEQTSEGN